MGFSKDAIARNLRVRRAELDMTQAELADLSGVNIATINSYENGGYTPGADKLWLLAEAMGCTPNDLLGWSAERRDGEAVAK